MSILFDALLKLEREISSRFGRDEDMSDDLRSVIFQARAALKSEAKPMSDKSIFDAIMGRDLNAVSAFIHREVQYTTCDICDKRPGHREMNASGVEGVICESCDEKLRREQR